jgi:hypothetical protein
MLLVITHLSMTDVCVCKQFASSYVASHSSQGMLATSAGTVYRQLGKVSDTSSTPLLGGGLTDSSSLHHMLLSAHRCC